jgi:hypothetical protein
VTTETTGEAVTGNGNRTGNAKPARISGGSSGTGGGTPGGWRTSAPARLLTRDVFGVRLWVTALFLLLFVITTWHEMAGRGSANHPPDSRYYLTMMQRDSGHPLADAVRGERRVSPSWTVSPWYFASSDPAWQMVRSRILYPFLSLPFVWVAGLAAGSLAIPVLSVFFFLFVSARTVQRLFGPVAAAVAAGAFALTTTIPSFTWAGTDTLAMALTAVIIANLPVDRRVSRANLVWLGSATLLVALTRQVGVLAPAMAGAGWLWALPRERSWRNRWLGPLVVTAAVTLVVQAVTLAAAPLSTSTVSPQGKQSLFAVLRSYLHVVKSVTKGDVLFMAHHDQVLLVLLAAAAAAMVLRFKSDVAAVSVGSVAATYVVIALAGAGSYMRYEMIAFPGAAVAVGALVALVADRIRGRAAVPAAPGSGAETAGTAGTAAATATAGAAEAADDTEPAAAVTAPEPRNAPTTPAPRRDPWVPVLAGNVAFVALLLAVSVAGGAGSSVATPASPSFAAAQGGEPYAVTPVAKPSAESILKAAYAQALEVAGGKGSIKTGFDWVHATRYRPTAPGQPGWDKRAADGTATTRAMELNVSGALAFSDAITLDRTVLPDTLEVVRRTASPYGEDVEFTVQDTHGAVHHGTATVLYPIWKGDPGLVTSLVYAP